MNKQKPIYVDKLNSENVIELTEYNGYKYNRYYFDAMDEKLYLFTRNKYKLIKPFNNGLMDIVSLVDVSYKNHACSYNKLINQLKEWSEENK